jgi:hypothetical protein
MSKGKMFSDDIRMEFGLDKCATTVFKHGKQTKSQNISLINQTIIRNLEFDEVFKYSCIEGAGIDNSHMEGKLMKEYYH